MKLWVALGDTPLLALKVSLNCVPFVHRAGLPLKTPRPFSLLVNVTPGGSRPICERKGVGEPVVVTVNELWLPAWKVTWFVLVMAGGTAAAVLVSEKFADREPTDAVTMYDPAMLFAAGLTGIAMPWEFVVAVVVAPAAYHTTLAPEEGAVNVTTAPSTGLPEPSNTNTCSGSRKNPPYGTPTGALCGVPPIMVSDAGAAVEGLGQLFTRLATLTLPSPVAKFQPGVAWKAGA